MKYSETSIWKIHLHVMDGEVSVEEYKKIYNFFWKTWVNSWVPMIDILACLSILRFGITIWEDARKEKTFEYTHDFIKLEVERICELTTNFPQECKELET